MAGRPAGVPAQFLFLLALQAAFSLFLGVRGLVPAFFLIWTLYLGWSGMGVGSIAAALATGIIHDVLLRGTPGWSSLFYVVAAYVNGFLPGVSSAERAGETFVFGLLYGVYLAYDPRHGFLWEAPAVARFALLTAVVNCAVVVLVEWYRSMQWTKRDSLGA